MGIALAAMLVASVAGADGDLERLHKQARSAAMRGDCAGRDYIVSQIEAADHDYYARVVATDPNVTTCKPGVHSPYVPPLPPPPLPPSPPPPPQAPTAASPSSVPRSQPYFEFMILGGYRNHVTDVNDMNRGDGGGTIDSRYALGFHHDTATGRRFGAGLTLDLGKPLLYQLGLEGQYGRGTSGGWRWAARAGLSYGPTGAAATIGGDLVVDGGPVVIAVRGFVFDGSSSQVRGTRYGVLGGLGLEGVGLKRIVGTVAAAAVVFVVGVFVGAAGS